MHMERFYRNLWRMERHTEMRRIQDDERKLFPELKAAADAEKPDTGAAGQYPWGQRPERVPVGVRKYFTRCDAPAGDCQALRRNSG